MIEISFTANYPDDTEDTWTTTAESHASAVLAIDVGMQAFPKASSMVIVVCPIKEG